MSNLEKNVSTEKNESTATMKIRLSKKLLV